MKSIQLLILLLLCFCRPGAAEQFRFESGEYEFFRDRGLEVLERFPPEQYFYVGMGRSPTVLVRFFQEINKNYAANLPGSGLKWLSNWEEVVKKIRPEDRQRAFAHLDKFFPSKAVLGDRTILLMDYVESGLGLKNFRDVLKDYIAERGLNVRLDTLAIMSTGRGELDRTNVLIEGHQALPFHNPNQLKRFAANRYREIAEYDGVRFTYEDADTNLKPRKEYDEFGATLRAEMAKDPKLVKWGVAPAGVKGPGIWTRLRKICPLRLFQVAKKNP